MAERIFTPLPPVPDHPALEREILELWEREGTFDRLREQNRGGPRFGFIDGPITANNPMGVHHAWGRTLKDVFQRYRALQGYDQRYQNGFDCQGLWVEVEVEKALGLNSKREIEEYGLAEFAERCKERVAHYAEVITDQARRLGMWMDWDNDYYTFSDTNIEYIWRFLKARARARLAVQGPPLDAVVPALRHLALAARAGGRRELRRARPPLALRPLPAPGARGRGAVIWTTTPWTLPANVAAAVKPDAEYGLRDGVWVLADRRRRVRRESVKGEELVGLEYEGPFDDLPARRGVVHRVIPWDEVSLNEGTGIVHIAPGAGTEDFELGRVHDLPVIVPIDEAGRILPGYGLLEGLSTDEVEDVVIEDLRERELLVEAGRITHRYPICWRCKTPLLFRVVDDWFISCDEIRGSRCSRRTQPSSGRPAFYSKRMDDWLRNMGDWNISRKRYFGLPLPFYPCECGDLNVVGSRAELEERATGGLDQLQELHRPWIDEVAISCAACGEEVQRIPEVGDAWLDAGIVPFSTLGWQNAEWIHGGYATGASKGLSGADLPDHAYWEQWFPADWISEMREQIRLWFYSHVLHGGHARRPRRRTSACSPTRRCATRPGARCTSRPGNAIESDEAIERMGADVMRWMYCEQAPSQNINFGYGPARRDQAAPADALELGSFLVTYANIEGFRPRYDDLAEAARVELEPLDRWLLARTQQLLAEAKDAYERYWTPDVVAGVRAVRRRPLQLVHPPLAPPLLPPTRRRFARSGTRFAQALRVIAPVMPFLAEHLWQALVAGPCETAPESVFLAGWPERTPELVDHSLLEEVAQTRQVAGLGHQAAPSVGTEASPAAPPPRRPGRAAGAGARRGARR